MNGVLGVRRAACGVRVRRAADWLDAEHGLTLEVRRPFRKGGRRDPGACLALLAEHLAWAGTAAIVGTADHWTAVSAVSGKRLLLADSRDRRYFLIARAIGDSAAASRSSWAAGTVSPSGASDCSSHRRRRPSRTIGAVSASAAALSHRSR